MNYQEQLEANAKKKLSRIMVALAELAEVEKGLALLVRDGIFTQEEKMTFLVAFIHKHPEIEAYMKERNANG